MSTTISAGPAASQAVTIDPDVAAIGRVDAVPSILDIICRTTGLGFAAIARVTHDRWVACSVKDEIEFGLVAGGVLSVETTLCREVREQGAAVVIDHAAQDAVYREHATPKLYGIQSYISVPIRLRSGEFFGTLCAIDPRPALVSKPETIAMFERFADLIAFHLDANERIDRSEATLLDERATAELREQFIAVLGHDLRNPLASVASGVRLLGREPQSAKAGMLLGLMQGSVDRMAALIDNVLDLARGRLGGGLAIQRKPIDPASVLRHVVDELKSSHPDRAILLTVDVPDRVVADSMRLGQLFSNLLGNALSHGAADQPIRVTLTADAAMLAFAVANGGAALPPAAIERLFKPFARGALRANQGGLGLGLYIASEIARAHGGTLEAVSDARETCFTFRMPLHHDAERGIVATPQN